MSSASTTEPKEYPLPSNTSHNIPRKPLPITTTNYETPSYGTSHRTPLSRFQTRWSLLRRRTRVLLICTLLALLALILGLSIGLSLRHSGPSNLPLPSAHGGPYTGDLTYYGPGLGACGVTSTDTDSIVSVSHYLFDAAQKGSDPNQNPLCGKKIRAERVKEGDGERSVDLTVVDRCVGCQERDLDVSITAFEKLADVNLGRVTVTWSWLD